MEAGGRCPRARGSREHGLPRLGKWSDLPEIITRHQVEEAIVAVVLYLHQPAPG